MNSKSNQFLSLVRSETEQLKTLFDLLQAEKACIEANKIDDLNDITANKQVVLDNIEVASRQRGEFLLAAVQAPTDRERLEKFIATSPADDREVLQNHFKSLEESLLLCKEQNNINAMIISMNQRHIERNMNILKGIDNNSMTYTNKGTTEMSQEKLSGVKA